MKFILNLFVIGLMGFFCYHGVTSLKTVYEDSFSVSEDICDLVHSNDFCYYVSRKKEHCVEFIWDEDICKKLSKSKKCYKYNSGIKDDCILHYNFSTIGNQIKEECAQILFNIVKTVYFFISAYVCSLLCDDKIWELRSIKIE